MDLPSDGGSIGESELSDGDGEPHDGDAVLVRPTVHLDIYWRVWEPLRKCPDRSQHEMSVRNTNILGKLRRMRTEPD